MQWTASTLPLWGEIALYFHLYVLHAPFMLDLQPSICDILLRSSLGTYAMIWFPSLPMCPLALT